MHTADSNSFTAEALKLNLDLQHTLQNLTKHKKIKPDLLCELTQNKLTQKITSIIIKKENAAWKGSLFFQPTENNQIQYSIEEGISFLECLLLLLLAVLNDLNEQTAV